MRKMRTGLPTVRLESGGKLPIVFVTEFTGLL